MEMTSKSYLSSSLILQTLQQLKAVYGDDIDKIVQGNAQPLDALIGTPDGWKRMGDIRVGDTVLTPYGDTTIVTGVYPKGIRPVYRVTLRDGSSVEVCNQHLWEIERYISADRNKTGRTCKLIHEVIDTDELKRRVDKGRQINLPKIQPLSYPTQNLPIHPYVLGVILGDGNVDKKGHVILTIDKKDNEILDRVRSYGYELTRSNEKNTHKTPVYYVKNVSRIMRDLGLAGHRAWEKFIPEMYLYGDVLQRTLLLQGLMDTDGTISKKGEMEFTSSSIELAEDVQSLVRSLGGRVGLNVKSNVVYTSPNQKTKKKARTAYRVQNIRLSRINPFMLTRKAERWHDRTDNSGNRVISVEYVRDDVVQCIRVADERHLYITNDYIPTHNTSNIIFLKSTDDSMLETLSGMSGVRHKSYVDSKTVSQDLQSIKGLNRNDSRVSYTMTTKEEPVISKNDMLTIPMQNSMVFRAGDNPVWNRNETVLPMSWMLFRNTICVPGKSFSLQTIPTLSSALDFDVKKNQPDFTKMFEKRMKQAMFANSAKDVYQQNFNYSDYDIQKLDQDIYSDEIMDVISQFIELFDEDMAKAEKDAKTPISNIENSMEDNDELEDAIHEAEEKHADMDHPYYAKGTLSKSDIFSMGDQFNNICVTAFLKVRHEFENDTEFFTYRDGSIYDNVGDKCYFRSLAKETEEFRQKSKESGNRVFDENGDDDVDYQYSFECTKDFVNFLLSRNSWLDFANGKFDSAVYGVTVKQ